MSQPLRFAWQSYPLIVVVITFVTKQLFTVSSFTTTIFILLFKRILCIPFRGQVDQASFRIPVIFIVLQRTTNSGVDLGSLGDYCEFIHLDMARWRQSQLS